MEKFVEVVGALLAKPDALLRKKATMLLTDRIKGSDMPGSDSGPDTIALCVTHSKVSHLIVINDRNEILCSSLRAFVNLVCMKRCAAKRNACGRFVGSRLFIPPLLFHLCAVVHARQCV